MDDIGTLKELIELRISSLERMATREFAYIKEAMDRIADESAPVSAVTSLLSRVDRLEKALSAKEAQLSTIVHKIRILWWVGSIVTGALIAIVTSFVKAWLGL